MSVHTQHVTFFPWLVENVGSGMEFHCGAVCVCVCVWGDNQSRGGFVAKYVMAVMNGSWVCFGFFVSADERVWFENVGSCQGFILGAVCVWGEQPEPWWVRNENPWWP